MVWAIAGCGVALAALVVALVVSRRRRIARGAAHDDPGLVFLHGDPVGAPIMRDSPHGGGGPDTGAGDSGDPAHSDSGGSDSGGGD